MAERGPVLLVLRALGLGDLLTGVPALRALRRSHPGHRIVLAAPACLEPLARLSGAVDAVADARLGRALPPGLHGADLAVNLHGRGPESHRTLLATGPRRMVSFHNPEVPESAGGPRWRAEEHEVVRWCRLLDESGIPADPSELDLRPPEIPVERRARGATLIHPGAASPARRWPAERWAAVARAERESGREVLLTGGPGEVELARRVARTAGLPEGCVYAGRTGLLELAALVAAAGRVLCGDTGVAHLATALGTPSVVLFGPVSPRLWGPPPERERHRALWAGKSGDPHAATPDAGLLEIGVGDVLEAIGELPR